MFVFHGKHENYTRKRLLTVNVAHSECISKAPCGVSYIENFKSCLYSLDGCIYKTLPKASETLWKREQTDSKRQKTREFAVRFYFLVVLEATPTGSHRHDYPTVSQTSLMSKAMAN